MTNVEQIRRLIHAWAVAVRRGDLDAVVAAHAGDIVMFDVPPPNRGVRGIVAYRDSWVPFFAWLATGAVFQIESLEVTAGAEVAFAYALLRCGRPAPLDPDSEALLRLTLGLRKTEDRWIVTHEHHSFPDASGPDPAEFDASGGARP